MKRRAFAPLLLLLVMAPACQLFDDKPAAAPSQPPAERVIAERGPLPPEEQPPAPEPDSSAAAAPPTPVEPGITSTGAPTRGTLPKAVVDEKLASAQPAIRECYEASLKTKPDLRGIVSIELVVAPDGKVAHAAVREDEGALSDGPTIDCILAQLRKLEFPEPKGGRAFLSYGLTLEPPK